MLKQLSRSLLIFILPAMTLTHCSDDPSATENDPFTGAENEVKLMTLNPGHFHAALVQLNDIDQVDPVVHVYAPEGPDLDLHMERIEAFNNRDETPTQWQSDIYTGDDYLQKMLDEQPGNVMVTAGNNALKTEYIKQAVDHGINVLSDKPMAIDSEGWELLVDAFESAEENDVLLYDIMTERNEVTSMFQRRLAQNRTLFGELAVGDPERPAIVKESVHHLYKTVAGQTLRRPPWYFDVNQQGEGIVDVTTHLVDLAMWGAFPDEVIHHEEDVEMLEASRWPTVLTREQFENITTLSEFPDYLQDQLVDGDLPYYSNGEMLFTLNGHHVHISVIWNYQAPEGTGDTHFSVMRGTRSNLVIRQGADQNYRPTLFVEPVSGEVAAEVGEELQRIVEEANRNGYPGVQAHESEHGWRLEIPEEYHKGHEAHFGKVAQDYFNYLVEGEMAHWEVPNMITKYYITTKARELALRQSQ